MSARDRWWLWRTPPALLGCVALVQMVGAHGADLSPWSGGGFGMFSTADAGGRRHLHAVVLRPGLAREVEVPPELGEWALRVRSFPTPWLAAPLARELAALPSPDHGPARAVRLQVWRTRFAPRTLAPSSEIVRELEIGVEGG
jgi:hypothetical protein